MVGGGSGGGGSERSRWVGTELTRTVVSFLKVERRTHKDCIGAEANVREWGELRIERRRSWKEEGGGRKGCEEGEANLES